MTDNKVAIGHAMDVLFGAGELTRLLLDAPGTPTSDMPKQDAVQVLAFGMVIHVRELLRELQIEDIFDESRMVVLASRLRPSMEAMGCWPTGRKAVM